MGHLQVGSDVHMATSPHGKRQVSKPQLIEVGTGEVGGKGAVQACLSHQGVYSQGAIEEVVVAVDAGTRAAIADVSLSYHVSEMPSSIPQLADVGIGSEGGTWRKQVATLPFGRDMSCDGIDGVAGHEVVDIQVGGGQLGIVAHGIGVKGAFQR